VSSILTTPTKNLLTTEKTMQAFDNATINVTPAQFAVIYAFIRNTRLGDRNEYETAVSDLALNMEKSGADDYLKDFYEFSGMQPPVFMVEASDAEGLIFNVSAG
jgi:hypothetical protein